MRARIVMVLIILGMAMVLTAAPVAAASVTVNSLADSAADDGFCTLREAITAANTETASGALPGECTAGSGADQITFSVPGTITLTSALPGITTSLSISGAGAITISGGHVYRVLTVFTGTVTLSGLTITAGGVAGGGNGAGILNVAGILTVTNSTISDNSAGLDGGGLYNTAGAVTVANSTFSDNTAPFHGGGAFNEFGTLTVTNSTFSGNASTLGGGIATGSFGGTVSVANSTFSGNTAALGGGILNDSILTVRNSTFSGNTAAAAAGGIEASGQEILVNTIVAGNTAPSGQDISGGPIEVSTTNLVGVPGGLTLADILVPGGLASNGGPTQTIALALVAGNPAIDTATSGPCAAAPVNGIDQRGLPRPPACDIGAYEAQPPAVAAHADVTAPATSTAGAVVTYTPPVGTDEQDGAATVACLPASGSTFPIGSTTVTCTATDAVGHTASGTFQVVVGALAPTPVPTPVPTLVTALPDAATTSPVSASSWALGFAALLIASLGALAVMNVRGVISRF